MVIKKLVNLPVLLIVFLVMRYLNFVINVNMAMHCKLMGNVFSVVMDV
jgi:hypothetical protein